MSARTLRRTPALAALLVAAAACSHGEPFAVPPYGGNQPFPASPARLTYSALPDTQPNWLPDGSALLYTARRIDFPDTTGCLELLPPDGGQATRSVCPDQPVPLDSTRVLESGAVSAGGQLAYLRSARSRVDAGWKSRQLIVTRLDPHAVPRVVLRLPFTAPLPPHSGLSQIRWLDERRFVYRADLYSVVTCLGCPPRDASSGLFIALVDLSTDPPTLSVVPGTSGATSVAVADSDTIVYTLAGDATAYRAAVSGGTASPLWTFAGGAADAVQVSGTRVAALVDGRIQVADLVGRTALPPVDSLQYTELALSPDGKRLVAGRAGDLWLYRLP